MLDAAYDLGVRTIFDLTTIDLGRGIRLVQEVANRTRVNVVVATGLHLRPPAVVNRRVPDAITDLFVRDLEVGIADTGVRAGIIKIASGPEVTAQNEVHLRAAARAHLATGAPIITHSDATTGSGRRQLDIFESEGVEPGAVVVGHVGDTTDLNYLKSLADRGALLGMDRFGTGLGATETERVNTIVELCKAGYARQVVLSHDTNCFSDSLPWKVRAERLPTWDFTLIPGRIRDALGAAGVSDAELNQMFVENVKTLFHTSRSRRERNGG